MSLSAYYPAEHFHGRGRIEESDNSLRLTQLGSLPMIFENGKIMPLFFTAMCSSIHASDDHCSWHHTWHTNQVISKQKR